jgi:hypothetical protein
MVNVGASVEHLREAHELLADPSQRALAAEALARSLIFANPPDEAVAVARQAVAELGPEHADRQRALEAFELYAVAFGAQVPDAAARLARVRAGGIEDGIAAPRTSAPSSRSRCWPTSR